MKYRMSTRRKLAIATWSSPSEGTVYGKLTVDVENALKYIDFLRAQSGEKVTITHLVGRAAALALKTAPDINGRIFCGRYIPHNTVDISFLVAMTDGSDLAKFKVCQIDHKSTVDIAKELRHGSERLRSGKDSEFEKSKPMLKYMPIFLLKPLVWLIGYITGALGVSVPQLGLEKFPFGALIITSVGMFGIDEGYAAPTPFARVPVYIAITRIRDRPVARNGQVIIRPELDLMATIDHRFLDGYQGALLSKNLRENLEKPWLMDGYDSSPWET